jgi:uncharacterized BrkB/YihY/UPF0761 family membrane protein
MATYSQTSKQASRALFIATLLLALFVFFALGFVSVLVGLIQHLMVPEKPWHFGRALGLSTVILLPALFLARFYFVIAARVYTSRHAMIGWTLSAFYHAALTLLFIFYMPGTVQTLGGPLQLQLPLTFISGAALCASLYLLVRLPRPPQLPAQ